MSRYCSSHAYSDTSQRARDMIVTIVTHHTANNLTTNENSIDNESSEFHDSLQKNSVHKLS